MLALPKRVGIRPNGAHLRCPYPRAYYTFLCASCLSALRADVTKIYPALFSNPLHCLRRLRPHSATAAHTGSTPRFNSSGCTNATRPGGGAHKPSQPPTRGFLVLGCGVQCKRAIIGREWRGKKLSSALKFSELYECN